MRTHALRACNRAPLTVHASGHVVGAHGEPCDAASPAHLISVITDGMEYLDDAMGIAPSCHHGQPVCRTLDKLHLNGTQSRHRQMQYRL